MFSKDEVIIYGSYGVCRITEITKKEFKGAMVDYYVLNPIFNPTSTIFVPAGNEALQKKMHKAFCRNEALELIKSIPQVQPIWIEHENSRKTIYSDILTRRERTEIIGLIMALHIHQSRQIEKKRRLHISDQRFLNEAQKTLCEELAFALGMAPDDIPALIKSKYQRL